MQTDREELIRQRAREIWEREGQPEGRAGEHWEQAAREVDAEIALAGPAVASAAPEPKKKAAKPRSSAAGKPAARPRKTTR